MFVRKLFIKLSYFFRNKIFIFILFSPFLVNKKVMDIQAKRLQQENEK